MIPTLEVPAFGAKRASVEKNLVEVADAIANQRPEPEKAPRARRRRDQTQSLRPHATEDDTTHGNSRKKRHDCAHGTSESACACMCRVRALCYAWHSFIHSFHSIPFHSIPFHSIPFHSIPFHSIPFHSIPFHSIPFHSIPFHSIPFHSIPFHSISFHFIHFISFHFI